MARGSQLHRAAQLAHATAGEGGESIVFPLEAVDVRPRVTSKE